MLRQVQISPSSFMSICACGGGFAPMADIKGVPRKLNVPGATRQAAGIGLIVLSTVSIAIVPSLAKFAYEGGSNTLSVITGRSVLSLIVTLLLIFVFDKPLRIPRRPMVIALAMGLAYAVMLYGYLGAVNYLAVNLVILIVFHPSIAGRLHGHLDGPGTVDRDFGRSARRRFRSVSASPLAFPSATQVLPAFALSPRWRWS